MTVNHRTAEKVPDEISKGFELVMKLKNSFAYRTELKKVPIFVKKWFGTALFFSVGYVVLHDLLLH